MNSKEFIKALRTIIREEVQEAVKTEFAINQVLSERKITTATAQAAPKQPVRYTESMRPRQSQPQRQQPAKGYSSNSMLNDILKQTAQEPISPDFSTMLTEDVEDDFNYEGVFDEYPTMTGGMRVSGNGYMAPTMEQVNVAPMTDTEGRPTNGSVPDVVFNAMNRDYSKVLKAAKEKSKIGR